MSVTGHDIFKVTFNVNHTKHVFSFSGLIMIENICDAINFL